MRSPAMQAQDTVGSLTAYPGVSIMRVLSPRQLELLQFLVDHPDATWTTIPHGPTAGTMTSLIRAGFAERGSVAGSVVHYSATAAGQAALAQHLATVTTTTDRKPYTPTEYRGWRITFDRTGPLGPSASVFTPAGECRSTVGGGDTSDAVLLKRAQDAIDRLVAPTVDPTPSPAPPAHRLHP